MQVTANMKLIKQRGRLGSYASLAGLVVLVVGMIASFKPEIMWVSLVAIVLGFILAQYGGYSLRRWGRSPRPDQILENAMKGFDDRYHYYAWSLKVPYVLLGPQGLYVFTTRDQTGEVTVKGAQWRSKFGLGKAIMLFAQEGLGNPSAEAVDAATQLTEWIRSKAPDLTVAAQPVVVFIDERAKLQVTEPTVPVLEAKNLKKWLRGAGKGDTLKAADLKMLEEMFNAQAAGAAAKGK